MSDKPDAKEEFQSAEEATEEPISGDSELSGATNGDSTEAEQWSDRDVEDNRIGDAGVEGAAAPHTETPEIRAPRRRRLAIAIIIVLLVCLGGLGYWTWSLKSRVDQRIDELARLIETTRKADEDALAAARSQVDRLDGEVRGVRDAIGTV